MHRLNELVEKLTPSQVREVEDFAEFLISRRPLPAPQGQLPEHKISFEGWAGCLAHVHPEMSDDEFSQLILDERAREALE